jgi:FAD/FMN-containing dehydrogenase
MDAKSSHPPAPSARTLDRFAKITGAQYALSDPQDMSGYLSEWRDKFTGKAAMVLRPGNTQEVSDILKLANETGTAIVPQAGNTGLVGAQIPFESGHEIVMSLSRLNTIRDIDPLDNTMIAEAGCILQKVQEAASNVDRLYPMRIGSQGTCQIGGNLGSNAGGIATLAYGNARDLVLGLEVVLADGQIWNGLNRLRKNNTGYDLKNIFIGSEGTLGVITAAALKLYPKPQDRQVALAGLSSPEATLKLLALARSLVGNGVSGFELLPRFGISMVAKHTDFRDPLAAVHPWYVLFEITGGGTAGSLQPVMMEMLEKAFKQEIVEDATIAASEAQADRLWLMREQLTEVQKHEGGSVKHDVSVPVSSAPELISRGLEILNKIMPDCRPLPYGHAGDGNIHFNISQPEGMDKQAFLDRWDDLSGPIIEITLELGGSISAEHGIGRLKRHMMPKIKSPVELDMMYGLKDMLDPNNILNPEKVLPARDV